MRGIMSARLKPSRLLNFIIAARATNNARRHHDEIFSDDGLKLGVVKYARVCSPCPVLSAK